MLNYLLPHFAAFAQSFSYPSRFHPTHGSFDSAHHYLCDDQDKVWLVGCITFVSNEYSDTRVCTNIETSTGQT